MSAARQNLIAFKPNNQFVFENKISYTTRSVSPDYAAFLLARSVEQGGNNPAAVEAYGQTMLAGAWIENGQAILLDDQGRVIDGRKRLEAAVKFGTSFDTLIIKGLKRDIVHTLDQHRRRTYSGVLEARGIENAAAMTRLLTKLIRIADGTFGKIAPRISWSRYDEVLDNNNGLSQAVAMSDSAAGCALHSTARPAIAYIGLMSGMGASVSKLFDGISDHKDLSRGHPAKELALQLRSERKRGLKVTIDEMIVMGLQALTDLHNGNESVEPYGWVRDWGTCEMKGHNMPITPRAALENAPANLGFTPPAAYKDIHAGRESQIAGGMGLERLKLAKSNSESKMGLYEITLTPDMAQSWLTRFNTSNRRIQMAHVRSIARDIRTGNWMQNAQPVCFAGDPFSEDAQLLNGQHRLMACVHAGEPIEILVATDLPEAAFETYDVQGKRSHNSGQKGDERVINSAALMMWRKDNGLSPLDRARASASEILKTMEAHEELYPAFQMSRKKEMQEIASAGVLTFFIAHVRNDGPEMAEEFLNHLMHGEGLQRGNPVSLLRSKLIGRRSKISRRDVLQALLDCWAEYKEFASDEATQLEIA
jgi:hypothetical protein